jgi:DNA (cytosine-5)-methyltransferase 1
MIIDASLCGVPQSRKRYVLIGCHEAVDGFMQDYLSNYPSGEPITMRQYFDEIGYSFGVDYYFRVPRSYNRRGVFSIDEPCQTIRGVDRPIPSGYKGHPSDPVEIGSKVRALTVLERSYIQTFPQTFKFDGTKSNLNQMIGNAVPVRFAEHIANAIIKYDNAQKR